MEEVDAGRSLRPTPTFARELLTGASPGRHAAEDLLLRALCAVFEHRMSFME